MDGEGEEERGEGRDGGEEGEREMKGEKEEGLESY